MDAYQLRDLIKRVLSDLGLYSQAAEDLLMGTASQESHLGYYIRQVGGGPALGVFQMEPATHDDIYHNYLRYHREDSWYQILGRYSNEWTEPEVFTVPDSGQLEWNLGYAICMTRLHYYRQPAALPVPGDVPGYAHYWKQGYNTVAGAGTEEEFIVNYDRCA